MYSFVGWLCPVRPLCAQPNDAGVRMHMIQSHSAYGSSNSVSTSTKAVFTSTKSPPNEGRCALAHSVDTETAHVLVYSMVYSHDCAVTIVRERYGFDTNWSLGGRPARD